MRMLSKPNWSIGKRRREKECSSSEGKRKEIKKKGKERKKEKAKQREPVQDFLVHRCCGVQQLFDLHSNR